MPPLPPTVDAIRIEEFFYRNGNLEDDNVKCKCRTKRGAYCFRGGCPAKLFSGYGIESQEEQSYQLLIYKRCDGFATLTGVGRRLCHTAPGRFQGQRAPG
jgi:hypothetical protein